MPDQPLVGRVVDEVPIRSSARGAFCERERPVSHVEAGPERRPDPPDVREAVVPGLQVLVDVRDVHRRAVPEVAVRPLVGQAGQRLGVGDPLRPERLLLRRGEAEEELGAVRHLACARDPGPHRHLLRQARRRAPATADEALADARDLEQSAELLEELGRRRRDVRQRVATEEQATSFCSSTRPRDRSGSGWCRAARDSASRRRATRGGRREGSAGSAFRLRVAAAVTEVRAAPADGHAEACGRRWERVVDARERMLERTLRVPRDPACGGRP